ncbi:ORF46 [White spot syndrome virus]|uniref:ORF46 n=1 Tax=White spot syndrome virus TaxID=342409 RepID=A0A2D3I683_9VIRU|nr:ORF46 [White spot syndrome virus]
MVCPSCSFPCISSTIFHHYHIPSLEILHHIFCIYISSPSLIGQVDVQGTSHISPQSLSRQPLSRFSEPKSVLVYW